MKRLNNMIIKGAIQLRDIKQIIKIGFFFFGSINNKSEIMK